MSLATPTPAIPANTAQKTGLAFWMERVLEECERARIDFAPDPVHDLRVALRRCRSLADGLMAIDPDPSWKDMKKAGKRLFSRLGELRDAQIMQEWVHHLDRPDDPGTSSFLTFLAAQEAQFKQHAALALQEFDAKQWRRWSKSLPRRAGRVRQGSLVFKHLALERWTEAHDLHQRALRNRSQASWHQLRIGIKRFRYIVENFLPDQHVVWKDDLKQLQDLLGEVHDLDVLWAAALKVIPFPSKESRSSWHARIVEERTRRIEMYRAKMIGPNSLWPVWRAELPHGEQIEAAAFDRLRFWASRLDPDLHHSAHVARLALQLYDGLQAIRPSTGPLEGNSRRILRLAALLHEVGLSKRDRGHHKASYRLIRRLATPLGIARQDLDLAAVVARYHRGALPQVRQASFRSISPERRREVSRLAGILRLANAFDAERDGRTQRLEVSQKNGYLTVAAEGYSARRNSAESIAAARHLLEVIYRRPVIIRPLKSPIRGPKRHRLGAQRPKTQDQDPRLPAPQG
jgi:CHAD domain-containing protein/HD superfamily phosphodiesterase